MPLCYSHISGPKPQGRGFVHENPLSTTQVIVTCNIMVCTQRHSKNACFSVIFVEKSSENKTLVVNKDLHRSSLVCKVLVGFGQDKKETTGFLLSNKVIGSELYGRVV